VLERFPLPSRTGGNGFSAAASIATVKAKKTYKLKLTFKPTSAGAGSDFKNRSNGRIAQRSMLR
jgi:hypothetical protein